MRGGFPVRTLPPRGGEGENGKRIAPRTLWKGVNLKILGKVTKIRAGQFPPRRIKGETAGKKGKRIAPTSRPGQDAAGLKAGALRADCGMGMITS